MNKIILTTIAMLPALSRLPVQPAIMHSITNSKSCFIAGIVVDMDSNVSIMSSLNYFPIATTVSTDALNDTGLSKFADLFLDTSC